MPLARRLAPRIDMPAIAAWTLAFSVVFYLALSNGGYDTLARSQVGIAIWWIVLLGALSGVLPLRFGWRGWTAIGLLAGFAVWTGVAATWSESAERTMLELGRVATYVGVLALGIALQGRASARHTVNGLACATGSVALLAVLSRLHPQWFPPSDHAEFLGNERRLSYPLNYWNALAAFVAMGVPLMATVAIGGRTLLGRAVAAGMLPACALCVYLTISRGGALAVAAGVICLVVLVPSRLHALGTLLGSCAGAAVLVAAASQRDALQEGLSTGVAASQGAEMIWLLCIVGAGVALLQVAIALTARHVPRPALLSPGRRTTALAALVTLAIAVTAAVAAGAPAAIDARWQEFKSPSAATAATAVGEHADLLGRLQAINGNSRYQYWQAARDAFSTDPLRGIGPGTFEFWWARHGTTPAFVRDAHSLYAETLGETGLVGIALLGGMILWCLVAAIGRCVRETAGPRLWVAGAAAAFTAFALDAALEWIWEMGAVAAAAMLLAAVIVAGRAGPSSPPALTRARAPRAVLAALSIGALVSIALPLAGATAVRDGQRAAGRGDVGAALADVAQARAIQPYAATPQLGRALLLEQAGRVGAAAKSARAATRREPTNWRTWLVLARIEARRGRLPAAVRAMGRARELNPRSPLFARP